MTNQETLTKAIQICIDAGMWLNNYAPKIVLTRISDVTVQGSDFSFKPNEGVTIFGNIFDHKFAKALWPPKPDKIIDTEPGVIKTIHDTTWRHHLQEMVVAEDPIAYLGQNMPKGVE